MRTLRKKSTVSLDAQWEAVKAQRNTWLFPLLVLVIIITSLLLVVIPQTQRIFELRQELTEANTQLEKLSEKRDFLSSLDENQMKAQMELAERALPSKKAVNVVVDALNQELSLLGLKLLTYSVNPGSVSTPSAVTNNEAPGMLSALPVAISASGPRAAVFAFLEKLTTLAPLSSLSNLSIGLNPATTLQAMELAKDFGTVEDLSLSGTEIDSAIFEAELSLYYAYPPDVMGKISDDLPPAIPNLAQTITELERMTTYTVNTVELPLEVDNQRGNLFAF